MSPKRKNRKFRWGRFLLWVLASIVLLVCGAGIYFYYNASRLISENLSDYIYQKTDSIYQLDFSNITIDFKSKSLSFSDVILEPDSSLLKNQAKRYYEFETSHLSINGIKFKNLIREKKFRAESFKVDNPIFKLTTGQDVDINMFTSQKIAKGDSLKIPLLNEIYLDTILVTDARLNIDTLLTPGSKIPKMNLEILKFKIGGKKLTDSPFPFDVSDISLKIENVKEDLADKLHSVSVQEISLSLLNSGIQAKELLLKPVNDSLKTDENLFRVEVPEIEIKSPYVESFYDSDTILITNLTFDSPTIEIKFGNKVVKGTPLNKINLYKLIEDNFKWVDIKLFSIKNADLKLYPSGLNEFAQHFENLSVDFTGFRADSSSYRDPDRIFSSKELSISVDRFTLNHNDKVHRLIINQLKADTQEKKVTTGAISFRPIKPDNKLKTVNTLIDIDCKGSIFKGVDFKKMYHDQIIPMNELLIRSPEANISFEKVKPTKDPDQDISLILQKTSDYVKGIYVRKTRITEGKLNYNYLAGEDKTGFFRTKFWFELNGLSIDSITFYQSKKIFFADNFKAGFTNTGLQLADNFHRLLTDSIFLSSEGKTADIYNFRILPVKEIPNIDSLAKNEIREVFDFRFPRIQLSGADLHRAFFNKELLIDDLNVFDPSINIEIFGKMKVDDRKTNAYQSELYSLISDFLLKINIASLKMDNGQLSLTQHRKNQPTIDLSDLFSIQMYNFELDSLSSRKKNKLFFSDNIDLILKKHSFTLADGVHKVDADEIGIVSTQNMIYIKNARMYPDVLAKNFNNLPVTAFANIPSVKITGADILGLFNKGRFPVKTITLLDPRIKLLFQPEAKKDTQSVQPPQFILKGLKSASSDLVIIKNGSLELTNYQNQKSSTFATTTVDFTLNNFLVENNNNIFKTSYGDFDFTLKNTEFNFADKSHNLTIGKANYKLSEGLLKISDFKLKPLENIQQNNQREYYTLDFPDLTLTDFNLLKFIEDKTIVASDLILNNPEFEINDKRIEKRTTFSPYHIGLYPTIKDYIKKIDVSQVDINDGTLNLEYYKPVHLNHLNLIGTNFLIDKNSDQQERLFSCENLICEMKNMKGKTKDGFYNYGIENIRINNKGDFTVTGMSLNPAYPEAEFNRRKVYQDDYITINHVDLTGNGFDIKRYVDNEEISVKKSNFLFDQVEIYRNNHYPLPKDFRIEMPQKSLRDMSQKFIADSISVSCNRLKYRELEPQASQETKLFFTDIQSTISHLTNIKENLSSDQFAYLTVNGKLMGIGDINAKIDMNLRSLGNEFTMEAECGMMPLRYLNPITEAGMKLSIKEGINNKLSVYFEANEDSSVGHMKFSYNDLKISVLSDKDGLVKEDKFISFLANTLAVKSDNPRPGRILIPSSVYAKRESDKSFVNYCWRSVFSGIKNTLGMKEKEEKP